MSKDLYLDTYVLQQDMRIRMPKQIITNLNIVPGETYFDIYIDPDNNNIILKKTDKKGSDKEWLLICLK